MKYHQLLALLPVFVVGCAASQTTAMPEVKQQEAIKDCKILSTELSQHENLTDSPIKESGVYCLPADVTAYRSDGADDNAMIKIDASDVILDLQGNQLYGKSKAQRVIEAGRDYRRTQKEPNQHITIRNGIVKSYNSKGIYLRASCCVASDCLDMVHKRNDHKYTRYSCNRIKNVYDAIAKIRHDFPVTKHLIEHVKISAGDIGVYISGGKNIIRNNVIMIGENDIKWLRTAQQVHEDTFNNTPWGGGTASIYLFGPNQLIENNIIIFKGKTRTSNSSAAPIKIHAADGTIIRNNTIIIESSGADVPQTAISIFDSKNVVIENNQIFGTKSVYKIWDEEDKGSSVKETGTSFPAIWKKPNPKF